MTHPAEATDARRPSLPQELVLRGYIKQVGDDQFVGVCLTLNLVVQACDMPEAYQKLQALIGAYLQDAIEDGHFSQWVPRRAPVTFYLEWWGFRLSALFHTLRNRRFLSFKDLRPLHA